MTEFTVEQKSYLFDTHNRSKLCFKKGRGVYLYSLSGSKYLDFAAGVAVNALGHCNKKINKVLARQSKKLWHVSNLYTIKEADDFAKQICNKTFADKVFFCNSGAEAVEGLIKLIRRYYYVNNNPQKNRIITFKGSFHGRTIATVCASGNQKYMEGFAPHLDGFDNIEYGDINLVKNAITPQTAGIVVEPIQGEGGVRFAGFEFLKQLRQLCDEHNILLGLDEVQCGNARTGKLFAYQHANIVPDAVATAKGIGNGFPLGFVMAKQNVAQAISVGTHGTTFGSNPLAMAVGMAVLEEISNQKFLDNVTEVSNFFMQKLNDLHKKYNQKVLSTRGFGLMLGLQINAKYKPIDIVEKCRDKGLLLTTAGTDVLRILPPLIITKKHVQKAIGIIDEVIKNLE